MQPDYEYCHKELMKDGVTLSLLYEEYVTRCRSQKKPFYKRTQFFDKYADYVKKHRLTMHINHKLKMAQPESQENAKPGAIKTIAQSQVNAVRATLYRT